MSIGQRFGLGILIAWLGVTIYSYSPPHELGSALVSWLLFYMIGFSLFVFSGKEH